MNANMTKYYCSHCGNRFEAEDREGLECPLCFWSSSVTKDSKDAKSARQDLSPKETAQKKTPVSETFPKLMMIMFAVLTVAIVILLSVFAMKFVKTMDGKFSSKAAVSEEKQTVKNEKAPSLDSKAEGPSSAAGLSAEDTAILNRRLQFAAGRPLSEEEKKIAANRASLTTGMRESLPSQAWTLEQFKQLLKDQQALYKVPLPLSYRRKLENVFKEKYVPAAEAFLKDDLLKARDLWVSSMVYPIYGGDLKMHRGVVLTMLRPLITDTLSKIGAINSSLMEKKIRDKEKEVSLKYQDLVDRVQKGEWEKARDIILSLRRLLDELENPGLLTGQAPDYSSDIQHVDEGIQATLAQLLQVPPPPVTALNSIREDVEQKFKLAESFIPQRLEEIQTQYAEALDAISRQDWKRAGDLLRGIDFPLALAEDAAAKIRVIRKRSNAEPDSEPRTVRVGVSSSQRASS